MGFAEHFGLCHRRDCFIVGYKINHTEKVSYSPSENLTFWSEKYGQGIYFSFEDDSIMPIISSSKAV